MLKFVQSYAIFSCSAATDCNNFAKNSYLCRYYAQHSPTSHITRGHRPHNHRFGGIMPLKQDRCKSRLGRQELSLGPGTHSRHAGADTPTHQRGRAMARHALPLRRHRAWPWRRLLRHGDDRLQGCSRHKAAAQLGPDAAMVHPAQGRLPQGYARRPRVFCGPTWRKPCRNLRGRRQDDTLLSTNRIS